MRDLNEDHAQKRLTWASIREADVDSDVIGRSGGVIGANVLT